MISRNEIELLYVCWHMEFGVPGDNQLDSLEKIIGGLATEPRAALVYFPFLRPRRLVETISENISYMGWNRVRYLRALARLEELEELAGRRVPERFLLWPGYRNGLGARLEGSNETQIHYLKRVLNICPREFETGNDGRRHLFRRIICFGNSAGCVQAISSDYGLRQIGCIVEPMWVPPPPQVYFE